ncbi:zinc finger protein 37 homolog isoform X1 [Haplochromis burtoni]|uniref:zinc finger protein 37 homolog isoform X1 n=1 Tax=Haplochromis burtoni TaxID=8153 RepID=UPI001C2D6694|nr:zinc finger protein 37 homolog isoform X1 [Haplochromis burtoni]XP_042072143.1 zinc finger protein 37 homolog isoform X1 [Haplochromis burtoni]
MSSAQYLREFIKERLTAVCEEIFSEVQKTIVQYEEEINRQHRLLDISRKPDRNSHIIEESLGEQQVCNQETNSSLDQEDPEPPQIKEEQEELCSSQEGEQLGRKQEAEDIIVWIDEEQLRLLEMVWKPEMQSHRIDLHQQSVHDEEMVTREKQVCNKERNSSLDQEDPEPPQIKEEQEELCSSQEGEQLGLKQEADTFMETPTYGESDYSEPEPNSEQFISHISPEAESRDHDESQRVDSGSARNAELKKNRYDRKRSHSQRVNNTSVSESQSKPQNRHKHLICDICGKLCQKKSKLIRHQRSHTGERPHSCNTCGKRFFQKSHLSDHVKIHSDEKPHLCRTCGKRFKLNSSLQRHVRIHTGEKPHLCRTCGKRFKLNSSLQRHVRIHTGEKPYSCSSCGKRYRRLDHVKIHMKIHAV